ncbi:MAG TPA: Rieske (2Fe-2S) protein [Actinocrinis sp.]|nr:Rieske (2Fe-2S) protein [Actinocrinis sp.]
MRSAVDRYVESLLRRRRPKPFAPTEDELAVTRTAIALAAAAPDVLEPDPDFVAGLRRQLAARQGGRGAAGTVQAPAPAAAPEPARPARIAPGRRRLLQATALTAGAAAVGATADHLLDRPAPSGPGTRPPLVQGQLTPKSGSWQTVAADADLPEGGVLSFDVGDLFGFVQRTSGRVQAVSGICTHQGCKLNLTAPPVELVCPCHGATYQVDGQPVAYPIAPKFPMQPLPRLAVRVQEGNIQVYAVAPGPAASAAQASAPDGNAHVDGNGQKYE